MTTKKCTICKEDKPTNAFVVYRGVRHAECRACEEMQKRCVVCDRVKPVGAFIRGYKGKAGSWCQECKDGYGEEYFSRPEEKERQARMRADPARKEYVRRFMRNYRHAYLADPDNRQRHLARMAANKALRSGRLVRSDACQCGGRYGTACSGRLEMHHHLGYEPEHWLDIEWLSATCHLAADAAQERSRKALVATGAMGAAEWEEILSRQGRCCFYCKREFHPSDLPPVKDHKEPVIDGGSCAGENVLASCQRCNASKAEWTWPLTNPDGTIIFNELVRRIKGGCPKAGQNTPDPNRAALIARAKELLEGGAP